MKKKILISIFIIFCLIFVVNARFCFQDNTFRSSLWVCDAANNCEKLNNGNCTNMNITWVSVIGADKIENISIWDEIVGNTNLYFLIVIFGITVLLISIYFFKKKK